MNERQQKILQILDTKERVSVDELSALFECSKVTIRNDIRSLSAQGLLLRVHGGALKREEDTNIPPVSPAAFLAGMPYADTGNLNRRTAEKQRIAAKAYEYISENDTIILDDSSACYYLAMHISRNPGKRIAVLTNSLPSALLLSPCSHVELYLIGGHVGGNLPATMGEQAIESFRLVFVDKAFISVHSINFHVGLTSVGTPQMQIKRAIFQTTHQVYVLADSSKFGAGYLEVICPLKDVCRVITDSGLDEKYVETAQKEGVALDLC